MDTIKEKMKGKQSTSWMITYSWLYGSIRTFLLWNLLKMDVWIWHSKSRILVHLFEISKENIEKEVTKANFITNLLQD